MIAVQKLFGCIDMLKSAASIALAQILDGAFALEKVLDPLDNGFQSSDVLEIISGLTQDNTLDKLVSGAAALRKVGTLGDITINELLEVLKPHVPELK
jgi:hypothetical protein